MYKKGAELAAQLAATVTTNKNKLLIQDNKKDNENSTESRYYYCN